MTIFERVGALYLRAGFQHVNSGQPEILDFDEWDFRKKFIEEELSELMVADSNNDMVGVADAIADTIIVLMGMAHCYHIPLDQVLHVVMDANDKKTVGTTKRGHKNDLIKPPGWVGPEDNIKLILDNHNPAQLELPIAD